MNDTLDARATREGANGAGGYRSNRSAGQRPARGC